MMIVSVISEEDLDQVVTAISSIEYEIDAIELRLDFLRVINIESLKNIIEKINYPIIFTLRCQKQGGYYVGDESSRLKTIEQVASLSPDYIDIEFFVDNGFIEHIKKKHPSIKIIRSYHDFNKTPKDLDLVLETMHHTSVDFYKIVPFAKSTLDSLRVLHFLKRHSKKFALIVHCIGPFSLPSRIIAAILGSQFSYTHNNTQHSPTSCCPDLNTLINTYAFHNINCETKVYALLGDPVSHSIGHLFHNKKFFERGINAVYLKIQLGSNQLQSFFKLIKGLPFAGFSITTPLKMDVLPFINDLDPDTATISAVNTIRNEGERLAATNTDGLGAVDAIEVKQPIKNRHVLVIGAGGAGRAIAHAIASRKPRSLVILNRSLVNALSLAANIDATACDYASFSSTVVAPIDTIVNTVPSGVETDEAIFKTIMPYLCSNTVYMGIDYSTKISSLSEKIIKANCTNISPLELYTNQALRQLDYWFQH